MTDKITEARRAEFEHWCKANGYPCWSSKGFDHLDGYTSRKTFERWLCWNAALDSVCVELPHSVDRAGSYIEKIRTIQAIHAAGVRTK